MADSKIKFASIQREMDRPKTAYESYSDNKEFIKYGDDNAFPYHLIDLANKSSIHNTCINAIVEGVIGEGLTSNVERSLERANPYESWNEIFKKVARDYKLFGGFALEVVWSNDGSRIPEVYHIDFSYIRSKEMNHRKMVEGYYLSDEWVRRYRDGKISGMQITNVDDLPYLPVYNPEKALEEPNQIIYHKPYTPGQQYYPLPDYVGALKVIELDGEVDNFHTNNIKNGLAPSLSITTFTNANDEERRVIEQMLRNQYGGSENAGSLMYIDVDSPENAPVITPIPQNGADDYYYNLNEMVVQKILTSHRITSPMILGIKTSGQLGGRTEVIDAYLLLLNTVIRPYQQDILSVFEMIFEVNYGGMVDLGVQQLKLYDDGEEQVDVVTSTEAEAGVDTDLEENIEQA
jgi:hypothetical protein